MIRVRAKKDEVLLRTGEEIPPFGVAEVPAAEAMLLHELGMVEFLSSEPATVTVEASSRECRVVGLPTVRPVSQ